MNDAALRRTAERVVRIGREQDDERALRAALLDEIRRTVGYDAYAWLLTDPETEVGSAPLADVPCLPELPRLIRLKYATDVNRWTHLAGPVARLQASTGGRPERSLVWRELLTSYDVSDVASVVFRDRFGCWGFLDLWRTDGQPFTERDAGYLAGITPAVTGLLRQAQARAFGPSRQAGHVPDGPVVLVLSPALDVRAQTSRTEAYLRALVPPEGDQRPVPAGAYNVAAQLLAAEAGVDSHPPQARVYLPGRSWLSLQAARMTVAAGQEPDIAVTIERATPAERMNLFGRAHGLSRRETDVLAGLATGADTRQLAADLYVSENTVQDHLKSIFAKTGARSRRALLARVLGAAPA